MRKQPQDTMRTIVVRQGEPTRRLPFLEITPKPLPPAEEAYFRQLADAWKRFECIHPDNATVQ